MICVLSLTTSEITAVDLHISRTVDLYPICIGAISGGRCAEIVYRDTVRVHNLYVDVRAVVNSNPREIHFFAPVDPQDLHEPKSTESQPLRDLLLVQLQRFLYL